eukprot:834291-Rhodomonas_salina.1
MFFSKTVLFACQLQILHSTLAPSCGLAATRPVAFAWRLGCCCLYSSSYRERGHPPYQRTR